MSSAVIDSLTLASLTAAAEGEDVSAAQELLQVFDAEGAFLGLAPRLLCHRLGLLHGTVFCLIGAPDGRLLLQTRHGGRLDVTVGGHLSASDPTAESAVVREMHEEIGLAIEVARLVKIAQYERHSPLRLSKPRDVNRELRTLFFIELTPTEMRVLDAKFAHRAEKEAVKALNWLSPAQIVRACDADLAADGLVASIPHYLLWRVARRTPDAE